MNKTEIKIPKNIVIYTQKVAFCNYVTIISRRNSRGGDTWRVKLPTTKNLVASILAFFYLMIFVIK